MPGNVAIMIVGVCFLAVATFTIYLIGKKTIDDINKED